MSKRIVLLDSSGTLHRCFHGYKNPRMTHHEGQQIDVAALYGYLHYVRILSRDIFYDELVHVFDPDGGSAKRFAMYPEYKANRAPTDPRLSAQKQFLQPLLEAFGHTCLRIDGVESDDVIATLCKKYTERGDEVCVVSSDKDLMQLVKDGSVVFSRYVQGADGNKTHEFYEEEGVVQKMGVRPDQIADYLALVGDAVDNIPGVFKLGEKTASKLLQEFGSLSSIMTNADKIPGKLGANIRDTLDRLPLYRALTTVFTDIEVDIPTGLVDFNEDQHNWARSFVNAPVHWPNDLDGDFRVYEEEVSVSKMKI